MTPSGTTPRRWPLLLVALTSLGLFGCGPKPAAATGPSDDEAADQLLFSLPDWCGKGPKQGWVEWHKARHREPSGNGLCGVALSSSPRAGAKDDGLCVEYHDNEPVRVELRQRGQPATLAPLAHPPTWGEWVGMTFTPAGEAAGGTLVFRVDGSRLTARAGEGQPGDGPCFWR